MLTFFNICYISLSILAIIDIFNNKFIKGNKDRVFFIFVTILATPIFYGILSYGHKINLTNKKEIFYKYIESFSITTLILITYSFSLLAISIPNTFGFDFVIISGYLLVGVIFFHIAYPDHWELIEKNKEINNSNQLQWFKFFPILINILIIIFSNYYNIKLYNLFIANLALLSLILILQKNSKAAFIFLTILSGPIFWFLNYFYIKRNNKAILKSENQLKVNLKSRFLYR